MEAGGARLVYQYRASRQQLEADYIWSTIPITALLRCLRPRVEDALLQAAAQIKSRAMLLIYLVLEQDRFSAYDAHYFPGAELPITRLSEPKNYSAAKEPQGLTALCAELPCAVGDAFWNLPDDQLGALVQDGLARAGLPLVAPLAPGPCAPYPPRVSNLHKGRCRSLRRRRPIFRYMGTAA